MTADSTSTATQLVPGYRLDRYELLCPVAEGGMASVWVARLRAKHGFEKLVAIKTILPKYAEDERFQQMFLDEARIASKIDHINVAHVLDLGDDHGVLYLVMEWVDGHSLSKLERAIRSGGGLMPVGVALRIIVDVCAGLHVAHELRGSDGQLLHVVHRDISPQNLLIGVGGNVKVIDFGIAKARDRVSGETSTGSLKGKIQFMSPEQALGKALDRRADVWSTGSVLYQMLSGEPPYDGTNQYATLHKIASGDRPPPLPQRVPSGIAAIVDKALAFDPDDRFSTMAEMRAAIEGAIDELTLSVSSKDVADLLSIYLAPRAEQRRKAIDLALRAAAERDRVTKILASSPESDSSPSLGATRDSPSVRSRLPTVPDAGPPVDWRDSSLRTLGAASMPTIPPDPAPRRRLVWALGITLGAALLLAVGRMVFSGGPPPPPVAAAPPSQIAPPVASPPPPKLEPATAPASSASASAAPPPPTRPTPLAAHPPVHLAPPRVNPPASHPTATPKLPIDDGF